jgi:SAM-dependent methyltransferase
MELLLPPTVSLEDAPCPLGCRPDDRVIVQGRDRISNVPGLFTIVECGSCGLKRTNPRPTPSTIGVYYPDDYGPYHVSDGDRGPSTLSRGGLWAMLGLDFRVVPPVEPGHLLELGCADGDFLVTMQQRGWSVEGIEFSSFAAQKARDRGVDVQVGTVEDAQDPERPPNVIAAWMVLEHLHQPLLALRRMRGWIADDGYLIFSVPDSSSLVNRMLQEWAGDLHLPNHLYHYAPKPLKRLLEESGWKVERIYWQSNAITLLRGMTWYFEDRGMHRAARVSRALMSDRRLRKLKTLLGILLGVTRQSGRIEVWARPV